MSPVRSGARVVALLAAAFAFGLAGCSGDVSTLNLNPFSGGVERSLDYNYFYRADSRGPGRVTSADLVGPDGRCAFEAAPAAPAAPYPATSSYPPPPQPAPAAAPQAEATTEPINPRSNQALYFTAGPQANPQQPGTAPSTGAPPPQMRNAVRGIALEMTECQVVQIIGPTDRFEIGSEAGRRSVILTYLGGERPGIYHFTDGRLVSMERVEVPEAPKKTPPRKKTAKAKQGT